MSIFDKLAEDIVDILHRESEHVGSLVQHPVLVGNVREALIQGVLARLLPKNAYEIGSGVLTDSNDKQSKQIDVVIARRDSPALTLAGGAKVFLIESVIATIEVKSHLNSKTLHEALNNCASVGELQPKAEETSYVEAMSNKGFKVDLDGTLHHENDLEEQRGSTLGWPATYVFGFTGYPTNYQALGKQIVAWRRKRATQGTPTLMRHVPSVVATQGCIAFRNAAPFSNPIRHDTNEAIVRNCLMWAARYETPLRMLIAHLLSTIHSKVPWGPDMDGIRIDPAVYETSMKSFELTRPLPLLCKKSAAGQ
jgi:hypothetical protein